MIVTKRVYLCPICRATAEEDDKNRKWMYANACNSTHFCRCCGTAMRQYDLTNEELVRFEKEHEDWLATGDNANKWVSVAMLRR